MLYEGVNSKWGLARGEDTSQMTPEERKEHRKKSKRKLEQERLEVLRKADEAEQEDFTESVLNTEVIRKQRCTFASIKRNGTDGKGGVIQINECFNADSYVVKSIDCSNKPLSYF